MGTFLGNLIGAVLTIVAALCGFLSAKFAGTIFVVIQYVVLAFMFIAHHTTKPTNSDSLMFVLPPALKETYADYHIFIRFPGAATMYSALINFLRLNGFIFAAAMLYFGHYILIVPLIAYFFLTSLFIVKTNPVLYMGSAAAEGNGFAYEQLKRIEMIQRLMAEGRDARAES